MNSIFTNPIWKNFFGADYETISKHLPAAMKEEGIRGEIVKGKRSAMLASGDKTLAVEVDAEKPYVMFVQKANCDPFTYFLLNFVSDKSQFDTLCFVSVSPLGKENKDEVARLFRCLSEKVGKEPWDVKNHPKMRYAWIMRLNIKRKWQKLLAV